MRDSYLGGVDSSERLENRVITRRFAGAARYSCTERFTRTRVLEKCRLGWTHRWLRRSRLLRLRNLLEELGILVDWFSEPVAETTVPRHYWITELLFQIPDLSHHVKILLRTWVMCDLKSAEFLRTGASAPRIIYRKALAIGHRRTRKF